MIKYWLLVLLTVFSISARATDCNKINALIMDVTFLSGYAFGRSMHEAGLTKAQITKVLDAYKKAGNGETFIKDTPEFANFTRLLKELGCDK